MQGQFIQLKTDDHLLAEARIGGCIDRALRVAREFCESFCVTSIIVHHNNRFIQVNQQGVVKFDIFRD